ncbi:deoxynucleoside kinase-like isoform X2 [Diachasmimorpha longicaudata]|uniref:deoxynucleoside kinase-like isoform X2 n=1 Tax=Diachasmimorpha longicaudata TaxID=58733 RepID=UPI0030B88748
MVSLGRRGFILIAKMASPRNQSRRPFTVCIEGNIGSGKTTFLNNFKQFNNTMVLQEPVELWRNVEGMNLLDLMYKDPGRYACLFQSYVQLTMLQLHTMKSPLPYKIMERSVYSARCFIENMKRTNVLKEVEATVLEKWYDWCINHALIETDLIVYLRTTPDIVYKRMRARARQEENLVSLEYLEQVHQIHEDWLYHRTLFDVPAPVIILDADQSMEEMFVQFEKCKTRIFERCRQSERESRLLTSPVSSPKIGAASE